MVLGLRFDNRAGVLEETEQVAEHVDIDATAGATKQTAATE